MLRICSGLVVVATCAQGAADRLVFEVASVKPSAKQGMITKMAGGPGTSAPGRFSAANAELSMLVMRAYGIEYDQLRGPAWMDNTQFDVVANFRGEQPRSSSGKCCKTSSRSVSGCRFITRRWRRQFTN